MLNRLRVLVSTESPLLGTAAVASVVAAIILHIAVTRDSSIPVLWTDEVGYFGNAQLLAGFGEPRSFQGRSYYIGWSLLLVPFWWITQDPETFYHLAVALSVVFGIAAIWPLALLVRHVGICWSWAVLVGAIVSLAPSRVLFSSFALAEHLVMFLMAFTAVAAVRYSERRDVRSAVLLGLAASAVFVSHGRTVGLLGATGLWFLWELLRKPRRPALAGLAVLGAVSLGGFLLYRWTISFMYIASADREASAIERIFGSDPAAVLTSATGQIWYQVATWAGVAVVGVTLVVILAGREFRRRQPGVGTWAVVALLGSLVVSATWVSRTIAAGRDRLDIYSYGRYLEAFGAILAAVGIAFLIRGLSRRAAVWTFVSSAVITAVFLLFVAPQAPLGGALFWGPTSVPGLLQWPWPGVTTAQGPPWIIAGVVGLALLAVALLLARRAPLLAVGLIGAFFAISSVVADERTITPYFTPFYQSLTLRSAVSDLPAEATVSYDLYREPDAPGDPISSNAYQYWTIPRELPRFNSSEVDPETDFVIARKEWVRAEELGAVKVADDTGGFDNALWVLPGPFQQDLADAG